MEPLPTNIEPLHYARLAQTILDQHHRFAWSLQGFGMLRCYITKDIRLHVWDSRFRVANVSGIHTHPWHFESTVLAGRVRQYRYTEHDHGNVASIGVAFIGKAVDKYVIRAGAGGGVEGTPDSMILARGPEEVYEPGQSYSQTADEIHLSLPDDGTVTLVFRKTAQVDVDRAFVYVPYGEEWVSAEPRMATEDEVQDICAYAYERLVYQSLAA